MHAAGRPSSELGFRLVIVSEVMLPWKGGEGENIPWGYSQSISIPANINESSPQTRFRIYATHRQVRDQEQVEWMTRQTLPDLLQC